MSQLKIQILTVFFFITLVQVYSQTLTLSGKGYDMHTEIDWNSIATADRYQIWRKTETDTQFLQFNTTQKVRWIDWTGRADQQEHTYQYVVKALSVPGVVLATSDTIETIVAPASDAQLLDMVQEYTLRYFYEYGHPTSGMARERLGSDDIVTTGGSGFGVMALVVGVQRGFITRDQGVNRLLKIVSFLQIADRFHGVFPHWMNGKTGTVIPFSTFDNGGDLVETAFLMEGLLCARQYFNQDVEKENVLRDVITSLWEDVEWDFYSRNNSGVLYWHWSPNYAWQMNFPIHGYNEALIIYLLAIASPTHPVDASYWHSGWEASGYTNGNTWYGHKLFVGPNLGGPLFFAHYSFMGFDPRNIKDDYANYFEQNRNHSLINRGWCIANPFHYEGYGPDCWGLTASDDPWGYLAHAPGSGTDNGTITPAASLPSMPYTPPESLDALKHFYRVYGQDLWGEYGFYDAFNPKENWFADSYLAIDQGPIINMIENFRSGLLWDNFMANPEIKPALDAIGFVENIVSTVDPVTTPNWKVFPTISNGELHIALPVTSNASSYKVMLTDVTGGIVPTEKDPFQVESNEIVLQVSGLFKGWGWIVMTDQIGTSDSRLVWIR
jgi:hypothetical protein